MAFFKDIFRAHLYPKHITSYDLVKSFALTLMIIDHIGHYFFPDIELLRSIGRLCIPLWSFLIGYSLTHKNDWRLIGGTFIFALINFTVGSPQFALTILITFYLCRLFLPFMTHLIQQGFFGITILLLILIGLSPLTSEFIQYGTQIFLFSLVGRVVRAPELIKNTHYTITTIGVIASVNFIIWQTLDFGLGIWSIILSFLGCLTIIIVMELFKPKTFAPEKIQLPILIQSLIKIMGRWTLELYLLNIASFAILANILIKHDAKWFEWHLWSLPTP